MMSDSKKIFYHLPGLFEFYELYSLFLPLYRNHPEYFYDWCEIGSVYGAPHDCLWGGGRVGYGEADPDKVASLMSEYGISSRLTFSNSLLGEDELSDIKCNRLCSLFEKNGGILNGVIITSDLLLDYIKKNYPEFYLVSSTTKVITDPEGLKKELDREEFSFVVPDFRLNKEFEMLDVLQGDTSALGNSMQGILGNVELDTDLVGQSAIQAAQQGTATGQEDTVVHDVLIQLGRSLLQCAQHSSLDLGDRLLDAMAHLLVGHGNLKG